jgi:hypothetical protein
MTYTKLRQSEQLMPSDTYTDTLSPGSTLQSSATTTEDDLNGLRSQIKRVLYYTDSGHWYDDLPTNNSKTRGIKQLGYYLDQLEVKPLLFRAEPLVTLTIPTAQNWYVLSVASSEAPTETAAVGAGTANGAVVASLALGAIGAWAATAVSGTTAVTPKNLVLIHDAATSDPVMDGTHEVYGLLQAQNGVVDGDAFDDTTKEVQISFVEENSTGTALVACPAAAIQGKTIHYAYVLRTAFTNIPEQAFLTNVFSDQSASVDVTLTNAIANQSGAAPQHQNIEWRIDDTKYMRFETSDGGVNLISIAPNAAGDLVAITTDDLTVSNTNTATFTHGVSVGTSTTRINLDTTAGQIDSSAALTVASAAASDLTINGGSHIALIDSYKAASTYAGSLTLSNSSAEWSAYETAFGEVSLLNAITQAATSSNAPKYVGVCTANIAANANVTGAGGSPNLDAQLGNYSSATFASDVDIFLNGVLMRCGADSSANFDVYPGTSPANGDLKFEYALHGTGARPDVITMIIRNHA